ncbi:MAG: CheR family methyltransferase [Candidatus Sulfotelmatobacter sp.]|jgi:chemotaxis methyl-accepting protein methylase
MHRLITTSTILEHEISELRLLIERQTGVVLDCPNSALAARVADFIEAQDLDSSTAMLDRLRSSEQDPSSLPSLLDGLVNTNTGFFRHPGALNALTRQVLPQLCARKSADRPGPIRIWSAGCGTGEETYSIAMAVCDAINPANVSVANNGNGSGNGTGKTSARNGGIAENSQGTLVQPAKLNAGCSIHIVGSDLLPCNIETADRGVYPQSSLEGLPPATIRNYFSKIGSSAAAASSDGQSEGCNESAVPQNLVSAVHLLVKPRLRSLVTFNCMNLARPGYIGRFDCIFCMDVLPHFSRVQRLAVLERLHLYLEPGGYLFLSQTEKLSAPNLNFRSETFDGYTFHRKPLAASAAYGR